MGTRGYEMTSSMERRLTCSLTNDMLTKKRHELIGQDHARS